MENTLQIDDKYALVFGLDWCVLDPLESNHEQIGKLQTNGARWQSTFKHNGEVVLGTTSEIGHFGKKIVLLSGAAQIATMEQFAGQTVLVMLEDAGHDGNPGLVVTVGLVNGVVSVDRMLSPAEAVIARQQFHDRCQQSHLEYTTAGLTRTIAPVEIPIEWEDLLPKKISRFKSTREMRMTPLKNGLSTKYATSGIGLLVILGVAYFGYGMYEDHERKKRAEEAARMVDPEVLYAASSKLFLAQPQVLAKDAFPIMRRVIGSLETSLAGWKLRRITCSTAECALDWERDFGTFLEFTSMAPKEWTGMTYGEDGRTLSHKLAISLPVNPLPDRATWKDKASFTLEEGSKWQRYSEVNLLAEPRGMQLEAVPPGVDPSFVKNSHHAIRYMPWIIKPGSSWYTSDGFDSAPPTLTYNGMTANVAESEITFEAKGNIYVK